jgi:hypothetical protein
MGIILAGVMMFGFLGLVLLSANMDPDEQTWGTHDSDGVVANTPQEHKKAA